MRIALALFIFAVCLLSLTPAADAGHHRDFIVARSFFFATPATPAFVVPAGFVPSYYYAAPPAAYIAPAAYAPPAPPAGPVVAEAPPAAAGPAIVAAAAPPVFLATPAAPFVFADVVIRHRDFFAGAVIHRRPLLIRRR